MPSRSVLYKDCLQNVQSISWLLDPVISTQVLGIGKIVRLSKYGLYGDFSKRSPIRAPFYIVRHQSEAVSGPDWDQLSDGTEKGVPERGQGTLFSGGELSPQAKKSRPEPGENPEIFFFWFFFSDSAGSRIICKSSGHPGGPFPALRISL